MKQSKISQLVKENQEKEQAFEEYQNKVNEDLSQNSILHKENEELKKQKKELSTQIEELSQKLHVQQLQM